MIRQNIPTPKENETELPKLMMSVASGTIVLMEAPGKGTALVVNKDSIWAVGQGFEGYSLSDFEDYEGPLTLENY